MQGVLTMSEFALVYDQSQASADYSVEEYWRSYGLKQCPFEDFPQYAMYYPIPHWQMHLQFLQKFYTGSLPLLLVEGQFGIGKTVLISEFLTQLPTTVQAHLLKGNASIDSAQLLQQVAEAFEIQDPPHVATIINHLHQLQKVCLLVVDDADLLPQETLAAIVKLAIAQQQRVYLYIVLTCELNIQRHLEHLFLQQQMTLAIPALSLNALNLEETFRYIKHRLQRAGLTGKFPFSKDQIAYIHELSGGVPGRINRVSQQTLVDLLKPDTERLAFLPRKTPFWANAKLLKILLPTLLFLIIAVFWWTKQAEFSWQWRVAVQKPTAQASKSGQAKMQTQTSIPAAKPAIAPHLTPLVNALPTRTTKVLVQQQPPQTIMPAVAAPVTPVMPKAATVITAPSPQVTENVASSKPAPIAYSKAEQKILAWQGGYTLQLLGSRNAEDLARLIRQAKLTAAPTLQFRTQLNAKPWHVLIYGHYATAAQAKAAQQQLPAKVKAWVRPVSSVQTAIKNR
jgi:type II secretory pathway predicted ATPase ExeA